MTANAPRYAGTMTYPDDGGLTAADRAHRDRVRPCGQSTCLVQTAVLY